MACAFSHSSDNSTCSNVKLKVLPGTVMQLCTGIFEYSLKLYDYEVYLPKNSPRALTISVVQAYSTCLGKKINIILIKCSKKINLW